MAKIALISDIHGNFTALEAVRKDINKRRIQRVICLGDLVGKGPQPAECVDRVRELCEITLQGNWDDGINQPQTKDTGLWQREALGESRLDYLKNLPFSTDLYLSGKWIRLFHASAKSVYHRVPRKASRKEKLAMFHHTKLTGQPTDAEHAEVAAAVAPTPDIVGYGDIHLPFVQTLKNKQKKGLILFNVGSVGAPYDGIPHACYAIIDGTENAAKEESFSIQIVRVPYDVEEAILTAEKLGMPDIHRFRYEMTHGLER
ncbi:metallophosphoesterase family protein [Paenibacillus xerothermodurans]|uniref:Metallophosphoesterase n=1 Tax=Paenibacillus xerothermodurans TaxID=1977292 RepID=A0A2W1N8P9_PAEXE|nr:metallophosphoesterase family protein [Paenibacillus xerothermodurans]PZE20989.1 metallophosphoesterase [Paenibacillus xerothermodurans]